MGVFKRYFVQCDGDCNVIVDSDESGTVQNGWAIVETVGETGRKKIYCPTCRAKMRQGLYTKS